MRRLSDRLPRLDLPRFALCFVCTLVTAALALATFAGRTALGA